jgi:hypothetical protein
MRSFCSFFTSLAAFFPPSPAAAAATNALASAFFSFTRSPTSRFASLACGTCALNSRYSTAAESFTMLGGSRLRWCHVKTARCASGLTFNNSKHTPARSNSACSVAWRSSFTRTSLSFSCGPLTRAASGQGSGRLELSSLPQPGSTPKAHARLVRCG